MVQFNQDRLDELCRRHDVRLLKLFGSAARGEDSLDSDIDLIVEFEGEKSLFDLLKTLRVPTCPRSFRHAKHTPRLPALDRDRADSAGPGSLGQRG